MRRASWQSASAWLLCLGQRPLGVSQNRQGVRDAGAQVHDPAPPVRSKTLLGATERVHQQGERLLRFTKMQIVKPQVDQRADLDIGIPNTLTKISAVAVVLGGTLEIAQFLVQPAHGVGKSPQNEHVVTIPGLDETVVNGAEGLGVFSQPDVSETTESLSPQFDGSVISVCCRAFPLLTQDNRPLALSTPVRRRTKPQEGMCDHILEASRLTDAQGSFELLISLQQFPVHLVYCTKATKTPRHHPLVTDFLSNAQRLFAQLLRLWNVLPRECHLVIERQVSERLALTLPIPRRPGMRAHVLCFSNRLWVARQETVNLTTPLIDFHNAPGWYGRSHPRSHVEGTGIEVEGGLIGVGILRLVTSEDQVIKRRLPGLALREVVG